MITESELKELKREINTNVDVDRKYGEGWNAAIDNILKIIKNNKKFTKT